MTYRDPEDPMRRTYTSPARAGAWSASNIVGGIVVLAIIIAALAYVINRGSTTTATGPGTTQSAPSTTGQGGTTGGSPAGSRR